MNQWKDKQNPSFSVHVMIWAVIEGLREPQIFKLKLGGLKFGNVWFTVRWQKTAHKLSSAEKVKQTTWTTTSQPLGEVIIHTVNRHSSDQFMGLTVKSYCMIILTLLTPQELDLFTGSVPYVLPYFHNSGDLHRSHLQEFYLPCFSFIHTHI